MSRFLVISCLIFGLISAFPTAGNTMDINELLTDISHEISGNRARDYTMRLWQYDKWSTLPMWQKTAKEAQTIMLERGFDEAVIVDVTADGVTRFGTWTYPLGWDCKQATLEVIEPEGLPDEYRYLCNYRDNPTSLNNFSCPTPPEGIESELIFLEKPNEETLKEAGKRGQIILVSGGSRGFKKFLDRSGLRGIVSDEIEGHSKDKVTANQWLNGWSDMYGGWQMNASDSRNNFGFSISQKKANYLRNLIRQGKTVRVRAKIDSRYITDDSLPYVIGSIRGSGSEGEDVLIVSHIYEWGANDDCTGASSDLEALGTLNDLIRAGILPRPKRTIRMWLGFEKYGSMAYTIHNLDRLRNKTIAAVCCDTPCANWDASSTAFEVSKNFNACPSFTDALYPEVIGRFHNNYAQHKFWQKTPFMGGLDNFFGDPLIGVPLNSIFLDTINGHHHNSTDTIDKVDPRSLKALSTINATYLYYLANAGEAEVPFIAHLAFEHGMREILARTTALQKKLLEISNGSELGKLQTEGCRAIEYYTGIHKQALHRIERLVPESSRKDVHVYLNSSAEGLTEYGDFMVEQFTDAVKKKAKTESTKLVKYKKETGQWEREASTIIPKRTEIGTLTLEGIPYEEWKEVTSSPRWWSAMNWATASYFWCDGNRNLNEIKELLELEAGVPVTDFDLIEFYKFLKKFELVEFVQ